MQKICSAEEMAAADRYTIANSDLSGYQLMERAARAFCTQMMQELQTEDRVAVLVGPGNNGGDGLAIARMLTQAQVDVRAVLLFQPESLKGDAACNFDKLKRCHTPYQVITEWANLRLDNRITWVVDAVFGTGLSRPISGDLATLVTYVNEHPCRIAAVDIPSGLSGSGGHIPGPHFKAHMTVTFEYYKYAHLLTPACLSCGQTSVKSIGIEPDPDTQPRGAYYGEDDYQRSERQQDGHKGRFGSLGILGGFKGMEGAAQLAANAALRFGVGKVRIHSDFPSSGRFNLHSVMVDHYEAIQNGSYDTWIMGPGLGESQEAEKVLKSVQVTKAAKVYDASALMLLARNQSTLDDDNWVVTPHPGEAAALLGCGSKDIQDDRLKALFALRERLGPGGTILLKGYHSAILTSDDRVEVSGTGNAALAVAGSGDVLAGMIGALLAQGYHRDEATRLACLRHGIAADRWVVTKRAYAMLPEDIIDDLVH